MKEFVTTDEHRKVIDYLHQGAAKMGSLEAQCKAIDTSVRVLERILTIGNGQPGVMQQLTALKVLVDSLIASAQVHGEEDTKQFEALEQQLKTVALKVDLAIQNPEDRRASRANITAVICALVAAIAAVLVAIFK